ncbi:MAG: FAD-dependent oxidoreductase [Eubacteriales bacterium]
MDNLYDVIIVGGGPAGLSAAIYMARAKYKVLVLEREKFGGQITITSEVVNYPGIFQTSGSDLTQNMQRQAENFGAEFKIAQVQSVETGDQIKRVTTSAGEYKALGIILAVGANPRKLGFEGEVKYQGRGVAYCATCDGEFFKGMEVYVIGGGFAAVEEGVFLTKYASKVHMIVRGSEFSCAKTVSDHLLTHEDIDVRFHTEVVRVFGDGALEGITLRNNKTGEEWTEEVDGGFGVFVFAGYVPNTQWLPERINTDKGYLVTDQNGKTNVDGIYGAGDVCIKNLRQVVTAVSDGAVAATSLEKYVEDLHTRLEIPELVQNKVTSHEPQQGSSHEDGGSEGSTFISAEITEQLQPIFAKFENPVLLRAYLGKGSFAEELEGFVDECKELSHKLICEKHNSLQESISYMELLREDGTSSGVKFQAIPGGHEFNSFIVALYNVAGPGKEITQEVSDRIANLSKPIDIKVVISLSCTMCPEVVVGAQQIAARNSLVETTMVDMQQAQELKEQYKIMSVPCMIVNDTTVSFGKKSIEEILDVLERE